MKEYTKVGDIRKVIPKLRTSTISGLSNDGQYIQIRYESADISKRDEDWIIAAHDAHAGLDPKVYTGILDRVFETDGINPQLCFTMLVLERFDIENGSYSYRTFNVSRGRIRKLKVL